MQEEFDGAYSVNPSIPKINRLDNLINGHASLMKVNTGFFTEELDFDARASSAQASVVASTAGSSRHQTIVGHATLGLATATATARQMGTRTGGCRADCVRGRSHRAATGRRTKEAGRTMPGESGVAADGILSLSVSVGGGAGLEGGANGDKVNGRVVGGRCALRETEAWN